MKLLADESLDKPIVDRLRAAGYDITYVAELDPGISDTEVLENANADGRILLTADKDFGELVFRQRAVTTGVVLVRLSGISPSRKAEIVVEAFTRYSLHFYGAFSVVSHGAVRLRRWSDFFS